MDELTIQLPTARGFPFTNGLDEIRQRLDMPTLPMLREAPLAPAVNHNPIWWQRNAPLPLAPLAPLAPMTRPMGMLPIPKKAPRKKKSKKGKTSTSVKNRKTPKHRSRM